MKPIKIFISYSHDDFKYMEEIRKRLAGKEQNKEVEVWTDEKIIAGEDYDSDIKTALERADIILFLISTNFINSWFIANVELKRAVERHKKGLVKLIPVVLEECDFASLSLAAKEPLPMHNKKLRPINLWTPRSSGYHSVVIGIERVIAIRKTHPEESTLSPADTAMAGTTALAPETVISTGTVQPQLTEDVPKNKELNFEDIKEVIRSRVCVLVIGPDLIVADEGEKGFYESFQTFLQEGNIDVRDYYLDEGFFYFSETTTRGKIRRQLEKFCNRAQQAALADENSVYRKIAQIPFDLILSFSPDLILKAVFEALKIDHGFHHYSPALPTEKWDLKQEIGRKPVLINLVGRCDSEQEIILTHEDFIRFFSGMYGHNKLPLELIEIFENNTITQFIILGYRYEKWHYKLLLDKLNFPGEDKNLVKTARCMNTAIYSDRLLTNAEKKYYEKKFLTAFCSEYSIKDFIEKLYDAFDGNELRKPVEESLEKTLLKIENDCLDRRLEPAIGNLKKLWQKTEGQAKDVMGGIIDDYDAGLKKTAGDKSSMDKQLDTDKGLPEREITKLVFRIMTLVRQIETELKTAGNVA